jgi:AcrR family transcriptional regulator
MISKHEEVPTLARQDRAERTRNAILDAAAEVFDERGFNGASLSEILAKAGVTKGALYFHFASKEELAHALIEEQWSNLPGVDYSEPGLQTLIDMSHAFGHNLWKNVRVRASNRLVGETTFAAPAPDVYRRWNGVINDILKAAQARGDVRKELDTERVAVWIGGAFLGIQTQSGILTGRADIHERITDMWEICMPGLVPPRRLSRFVAAGTIQWETSAA